MNRRNFIKSIAYTTIAGAVATKSVKSQSLSFNNNTSTKYFKPEGLKEGDKVAIVSPASPTSMWSVHKCANYFRRLGIEVEHSPSVSGQKNQHNYFSAPDEDRAKEFMDYIKRKDIKALIAARGGYGSPRILNLLDYNVIKENPKIILGYSDITALLNAITHQTGMITYHGPVASSEFSGIEGDSLQRCIFQSSEDKTYAIKDSQMWSLVPGKASGEIVGGNLSIITGLLGTPYDIDFTGKIVALEETREAQYKIDKMLTQLVLSGKLHSAAGIILGQFNNLNSRRPFFPNRSLTVKEILDQLIKPIGKPTIYGVPFGHIDNQYTLPIGGMATIDAINKSVYLEDSYVV